MRRPTRFRRATALWVVGMLLLQSAMALFAAEAARAQSRALVEVCTAFGVATVPVDSDPAHTPAKAGGHGDCLLTHLGVGVPGTDAIAPVAAIPAAVATVGAGCWQPTRDRCAAWYTGKVHAPPGVG